MKFKPAENKIVVQYLDESEDDELPQPQPNAYSRNQTARSKAVYAEVLGVGPKGEYGPKLVPKVGDMVLLDENARSEATELTEGEKSYCILPMWTVLAIVTD